MVEVEIHDTWFVSGLCGTGSQDISTTNAGTRYVVAPILPAVVRFSAYAQVVNASAVGTTPR